MINKQILKDNAIIGIVGRENGGKSNLMYNLLDFIRTIEISKGIC